MPPVTATLPGVRAVVFDFDGVVIESVHIKTEAFLELFAGHPEHRQAILRHHLDNLGISRYEKFKWVYRKLLKRPLSSEESDALAQRYSGLVLEKALRCPAVPGALAALEALRERRLAFVASGTPQGELDRIVDERGLRPFFREVWGYPALKEPILRDLMERFELSPSEVLMVGDGFSDYQAATATGVHFLLRRTTEQEAHFKGIEVLELPDLRDFLSLFDTED